MFSRRNFLFNIALSGAAFGLKAINAQTSSEMPLKMGSDVQAVKEKILQIYQKQSEKFKESKGFSLDQASQFYLNALKDIAISLKPILGKDISEKVNAQNSAALIKDINSDLIKLNLGLSYNLIRIADDLFAINIRLYQGREINSSESEALLKKIGLKDYKKVPVMLVENAFTPDVRHTEYFPANQKDPVIYGQTITEESGQVEQLLIFEQAIQKRAEVENLAPEPLRNMVIVNEIANAFFRQRVPVEKWADKISDQLTMRHVSEAFSDYCSLSVCDKRLLLNELSRIMNSSNPNYLLSKALSARVLLPIMKQNNFKDLSQVLNKLEKISDAEFEIFKKSLLSSYSEYEALQDLLKH